MKRIHYNSPVILTFSIAVVIIHLLDWIVFPKLTRNLFVVRPTLSLFNPLDYFRLFSHILGHANWKHLFGNLTYILLLGPILEEKYGSPLILLMILFTALSIGIINMLLFSTGLLGASGIVFMLIILASVADMKQGSIPLTFILVASIFISNEIVNAFRHDNISQMAHIMGGAMGATFGFIFSGHSMLFSNKNSESEKRREIS